MLRPRLTYHAMLFALLSVAATGGKKYNWALYLPGVCGASVTAKITTVSRTTPFGLRRLSNKRYLQTPQLAQPYANKLDSTSSDESEQSDNSNAILKDRHNPTLPNRQPYDVEPTNTLTFTTSGDGGSSSSADSSLGLPFLIVIGGSVFLVLTGVVVAARKLRNDDEDNDDADDDDGLNDGDIEAMENEDVHKEAVAAAAAAGASTPKKTAMDFTSIVSSRAVQEDEVELDAVSDVASTVHLDSSMDTTDVAVNDGGEDAQPRLLLGDGTEDDAADSDDAGNDELMLTI